MVIFVIQNKKIQEKDQELFGRSGKNNHSNGATTTSPPPRNSGGTITSPPPRNKKHNEVIRNNDSRKLF